MKITFHGAAREVTGSCYRIESKGKTILVDCGLFQGTNGAKKANRNIAGFSPKDVSHILLTHGHLDHCGRIPVFYNNGFRGNIVTTAPSRDIAKLVLLDSAHLQEEDAKRPKGSPPLYTTEDVLKSMGRFRMATKYGETVQLADHITATFFDAGHILGSASIALEIQEGPKKHRVIFSGDIGNSGKPIVRDPTMPPEADIVIEESTYGDRLHKPLDVSIAEFYDAINRTFERGGNIFIPSFAIERTQDLLFFLREGVEKAIISPRTKVFLDSPMAITATELFRKHPEYMNTVTQELLAQHTDPFAVPSLTLCQSVEASKAINDVKSGAIVIAGSGMCNGGRILHHMKNNLSNSKHSFVFVGFAPEDSLPHRIITGIRPIRIYGEEVPVNAEIITIGGFSAHGDQGELLRWHCYTGSPETTFLTHGSTTAINKLAGKLISKNQKVHVPQPGETFQF